MDNHAVAVNVKHFIARLILNNEKVESKFASNMLNYLVSCGYYIIETLKFP